MKDLSTLLFFLFTAANNLCAQNCHAFLYQKDTLQYEACRIAEDANGLYQYSREYQEILDKALTKCPYFSYAYRNKSVAYLKSGDFITWKYLIDKAVEYNKKENIGYRGWCRFQFFNDYKGAIADIEELETLTKGNIGYSAGGQYHLRMAKALCYKKIDQKPKAISIIEELITDSTYSVSVFDYLHLGVLYLEVGRTEEALQTLLLQEKENDISELHYYIALCYKKIGNLKGFNEQMIIAKKMHDAGKKMTLHYTEPLDRVYLTQIEEELKQR